MNNLIRLANGGTVRINADIWEAVQSLSVELSVKVGRPIKESTVIQLLLLGSVKSANVEELALRLED